MKHITTVLETRRTAAKHVHRTSPDPLPAFVSRISDKFCSCNHCLSEIFTNISDLKKPSCQHLQNLGKPTQTQTQMFAVAADFSELLVATTEILIAILVLVAHSLFVVFELSLCVRNIHNTIAHRENHEKQLTPHKQQQKRCSR